MVFHPLASNTRGGNLEGESVLIRIDTFLCKDTNLPLHRTKAAFKFLIHSSKLANAKKIAKHIYKTSPLHQAVQAMNYPFKMKA